jgi:peptide deformylase
MSLLTILEYPDPKLRTIAKPVTEFDDHLQTLIDDMFETMYNARGIGLAATQVDHHIQVIVMDLSEDKSQPKVFTNPAVTITGDAHKVYEEGCLSVPGFHEKVDRPADVRIDAMDREGKPFSIEADELLAVCIQHEMDHLNGKLFVDYLSALKRNRIKDKLVKAHRKQKPS